MQMDGVQLLIQPSCVSMRAASYILLNAWQETEEDVTIFQRSTRLQLSDTRDSENHRSNNNKTNFADCLFPKTCFVNTDKILFSLYMEVPTPPFLHASSHSKATCLFEYRIELYWRLALVLIPPPKTIRSCQRDMQMHRASEMPLQHFHSMPLG